MVLDRLKVISEKPQVNQVVPYSIPMLLAKPKLGVVSFETKLIILPMTTCITQSTSSP